MSTLEARRRAQQTFSLKLKREGLCRRCARKLVEPDADACETCVVILQKFARSRYERYRAKGWRFTVAVVGQQAAMARREG